MHRAGASERAHGHAAFCGATPLELVGMARAGLGDDLLLANETVDGDRLRALAALDARITVGSTTRRPWTRPPLPVLARCSST